MAKAHGAAKTSDNLARYRRVSWVCVDIISSAVLRGVSHEGRLIGREMCNQEQEGNRNTQVRQVQAVSMT